MTSHYIDRLGSDRMRLQGITINNFRSIRSMFRVPLSDMTVLVGPNNVGKSNVLRALVIALRTLIKRDYQVRRFRRIGLEDQLEYDWERDYPIDLQESEPEGVSTFLLDFGLSPDEEELFRKVVGSKVKKSLPIEVRIGAKGPPTVVVRKRGPGSAIVSKKAAHISGFLSAKLDAEYIPAVRTASASSQILERLVNQELAPLENDPQYKAALEKVREARAPILTKLGKSVTESLKSFLPNVKSVEIEVNESANTFGREVAIIVDDGTAATNLRYKGDGVQSLATVALLRFASSAERGSRESILVLEEPESHLHPAAIREFHEVLRTLASKQQVIISTHNGLFVDREFVDRNVIVEAGEARPAKKVEEIRRVLGIMASDNLQHAEQVLVVEGEDDRISLAAILADRSATLKKALHEHRLAIDTLAGANNLVYKLGLLRNGLSSYLCFLDGDTASHTAVAAAKIERLVDDSNVLYATLPSLTESEFEDLLDDKFVGNVLSAKWAIATTALPPRYAKRKWSDRIREVFRIAGKKWGDDVEAKLKQDVAEAVAASPSAAVRATTSGPIDNLVALLEKRLTR